MADNEFEQLRTAMEDLVEVLRLQAQEMEKLVVHVEQHTGHLAHKNQMLLVISELNELHARVGKLGREKSEKAAPRSH